MEELKSKKYLANNIYIDNTYKNFNILKQNQKYSQRDNKEKNESQSFVCYKKNKKSFFEILSSSDSSSDNFTSACESKNNNIGSNGEDINESQDSSEEVKEQRNNNRASNNDISNGNNIYQARSNNGALDSSKIPQRTRTNSNNNITEVNKTILNNKKNLRSNTINSRVINEKTSNYPSRSQSTNSLTIGDNSKKQGKKNQILHSKIFENKSNIIKFDKCRNKSSNKQIAFNITDFNSNDNNMILQRNIENGRDFNVIRPSLQNTRRKREDRKDELSLRNDLLSSKADKEFYHNKKNTNRQESKEWNDLLRLCNLTKKELYAYSRSKYTSKLIDFLECVNKLIIDKNYQINLLLEENRLINKRNEELNKENIILIQQNINIVKKSHLVNIPATDDFNKNLADDSNASMVKQLYKYKYSNNICITLLY